MKRTMALWGTTLATILGASVALANPPPIAVPNPANQPAGEVTGALFGANWYTAKMHLFMLNVGGKPGKNCSFDVTFTNEGSGKVYKFPFTGKLPEQYGAQFPADPEPGHYEVKLTPTPQAAPGYPQITPCTGSAKTTTFIGAKELGHPVMTFGAAEWEDHTSYVRIGSAKPLSKVLDVPFTDISNEPNARTCSASVIVKRPKLNVTTTSTFAVTPASGSDSFKVDVPKIIRQLETEVGDDTYEVEMHATPVAAQAHPGIPPCVGHVKATLIGTHNAVVHVGVDYTTESHLDLSGQQISKYTVRIKPHIEGPKCAYTMWVHGNAKQDPSNTWHFIHPEHGSEQAAEFDIDSFSIGNTFEIHVHSKPEDASSGAACMGEYETKAYKINYHPPPGKT